MKIYGQLPDYNGFRGARAPSPLRARLTCPHACSRPWATACSCPQMFMFTGTGLPKSVIISQLLVTHVATTYPWPMPLAGLRRRHHFFLLARLDALSGLIFAWAAAVAAVIWVAKLQFPFFHFMAGSGVAVQYQLDENSVLRSHPSHCSTTSWQAPSLYEQPFAVIKGHSTPSLTVVQFIGIT